MMEAKRWWILFLATWVQASATMITYGVGPLSTYWQQQMGLSQSEAGFLVSIVNAGPLLSMIWVGKEMDRRGERWMLGMGLVLLGCLMFGVLYVKQYLLLGLLLSGIGLLYGVAQPGGTKLIATWFPEGKKGLAMGIRQAAIPIGGGLAGSLIATLAPSYGISVAIAFLAGFALMSGMVFLLGYRDQRGTREQVTSSFLPMLSRLIRNKNLYPILGIGMMLVSVQAILVAHFFGYLTEYLEINERIAGLFFAITFLTGAIGRIVLPWLYDRLGMRNYYYGLLLTAGCIWVGMIFLSSVSKEISVEALFCLSCWLGFFGFGWYSFFILEITKRSEEHAIGLTVGYVLTWNQIALIMAPWLFGIFVDGFHDFSKAWNVWSGFILIVLMGFGIQAWIHTKKQSRG
ncbi:MFS transporter [Thermoflavimicrobium dichotomicum]|uniref:Nitrate/nitrite transporter NarK n=1 Tax=Thermoflavimicrobium dichotomicum TaxID=46223 RepID=A0A1I3T028_9BACL|nr:MFS transporter [Thermoflavimicrobium dichotomicum]SFJ64285.1 Nitrate/nitrite transporter NarK [Thermoflavimicrobium dichotomicum]